MEEQDDDLFMDQESDLSSLVDSESTAGTWMIKLDSIEPGLLLVSSIGSDEFSKYVSGPDLYVDLQALMKSLDQDLSHV